MDWSISMGHYSQSFANEARGNSQMYAVAPIYEGPHIGGMSEADAASRRQRVLDLIEARGLSVNAAAIKAGFREGTLRAYLKSDTRELSLANYEALAEALGVEPCRLVFGVNAPQELSEQQRRFLSVVPDMLPSQYDALWKLVKELAPASPPSSIQPDPEPRAVDPPSARKRRSRGS